ncbi:MAG: toll/interleukin-1 receptor domain-containing protein [Anaerolineae bacterium]|nr:toll/interleukin-1 receptor domain-containing protein [Anaerolineae bacterium]
MSTLPTTNVFISYSRQQVHFAESLSLKLIESEIAVWFDLQQLRPGCHWQQEIDRGLASSDRLVLIASQKAVQSPYVRQEWEHALAHQLPIYVCIYEAVDLPDALKDLPIIDFRVKFDDNAARLIDMLKTGEEVHDAAPHPNRFNIPTRMPRSIWAIALTSALFVLAIIVGAVVGTIALAQSTTVSPLVIALLLPIAGWLSLTYWRLLRHRIDFENLRFLAVFPAVVIGGLWLIALLITLLGLLQAFGSTYSQYNDNQSLIDAIVLVLATAPVALLFIYAGYSTHRSADVLRWLPPTRVPARFRERVASRIIDSIKQARNTLEGTPKLYALHYAPADENIARLLREKMGKYQHQEVPAADADTQIAILSDKTPREDIDSWLVTYAGEILCLVVTPIDIDGNTAHLTSLQWVNCRTDLQRKLDILAFSLRGGEDSNLLFSFNVVPEDVRKFQHDPAITLLATAIRLIATGSLGAVLVAFLSGFNIPVSIPIPVTWLALYALNTVLGIWLTHNLFARRLTLRWVILGILTLNLVNFALTMAMVREVYPPQEYNSALVGFLIGVAIINLPWLVGIRVLRRWLPKQSDLLTRTHVPTLRRPFAARIAAMTAFFVAVQLFISSFTTDTVRRLTLTGYYGNQQADTAHFVEGQGYYDPEAKIRAAFPKAPLRLSSAMYIGDYHVPAAMYELNDGMNNYEVAVLDVNAASKVRRLDLTSTATNGEAAKPDWMAQIIESLTMTNSSDAVTVSNLQLAEANGKQQIRYRLRGLIAMEIYVWEIDGKIYIADVNYPAYTFVPPDVTAFINSVQVG